MAARQYRQLLNEISQLTLIPESVMSQELTNLAIQGVDFSLYSIDGQPEQLMIHTDMGPLPDRRREEALLRLLDTNFFLFDAPRTLAFSRNAQNGRIILSVVQPLAGLSGKAVIEQLGVLAVRAQVWRQNFFEDESLQINDSATTRGDRSTPLAAKTTFSRRALP